MTVHDHNYLISYENTAEYIKIDNLGIDEQEKQTRVNLWNYTQPFECGPFPVFNEFLKAFIIT